jgi:serine phosphatase RsbU (regulator of sigma subunit)/anti-sigma regulatory factor (Ser/Thr protein kinase)
MTTFLRTFWQSLTGQRAADIPAERAPVVEAPRRSTSPVAPLDIAPNDPLVLYFQTTPGAVEIDRLNLESPALRQLRAAGVKLVMPLVSQGELVGLLNLGPRLSEQDYSADDRALLNNLAAQAAPALRVAQLVRQQQAEAQARERLEQELRVARLIQQTLLPKELPALDGWQVAAYYQPARAVGGDFYDFIDLADGRMALVVGDVTDKGVPAALVMATTRSILRSVAAQYDEPGQVLERANNLLVPDIPRNMFVTCLYAILDPATGRMVFANAGHDLPYRHGAGGVDELRATGMPLGLLPGMGYEQKEVVLSPGDRVLFYSDGLVEAHAPDGQMFGFPRLRGLVGAGASAKVPADARDEGSQHALVKFLLDELAGFTGPDWEQEDDVTLMILERKATTPGRVSFDRQMTEAAWRPVTEFSLSSEPGNERLAMLQVADAIKDRGLPEGRLERLKTAVAEATMNAMEHGNKYQADLMVVIRVLASDSALAVRITDHGGGQPIPEREAPNLEAKLAGQQSPRGWGLFLIKNMVDDMNIASDETHHTVELIMRLPGAPEAADGGQDGNPAV